MKIDNETFSAVILSLLLIQGQLSDCALVHKYCLTAWTEKFWLGKQVGSIKKKKEREIHVTSKKAWISALAINLKIGPIRSN